jgi:TPR repeat protein
VVSLWTDRLAEVWASPGYTGTGIVLGADAVLTARHVVADAKAVDAGRVLARVVRPGLPTAQWASVRVDWESPDWDLALLAVVPESLDAHYWQAPQSREPEIVSLGASAEESCQAAGFPDSAVQRQSAASPSEIVRQPEQVVGTVLPAGQSKAPVDPERHLPHRWIPFDIDTSTPETQREWRGMSGAAVALADGRLIGIVVTAEADHQRRRLYLVPLAAVLERCGDFVERVSELTGGPLQATARDAPRYRAVLKTNCLGSDGLPQRLSEIEDLMVFGVKAAGLPGEPAYLDYVPRDDDNRLHDALSEATESRKIVLVVGASAAGKTRSTAEAARTVLSQWRLLVPRAGMLAFVADLPLAGLGPTVVWLDDAQHYAHPALRDTLQELLDVGVGIVGTIRLAELDLLDTPGDVRNPAGEALTDETLVRRIDWRLRWSPEERVRLAQHVAYQPLLDAVSKGVSVGAYSVSGPLLVQRFSHARNDEERPYRWALVRAVLDWYRTGIAEPIPLNKVISLMPTIAGMDSLPTPDETTDALDWAMAAEIGAGPATRQSLLSLESETETLTVNDYVLDHDQRGSFERVPDLIWVSAIEHARTDSLLAIGVAAFWADKLDFAVRAMEPLAGGGNVDAMFNLGLVLADSDAGAAQRWYERAADAGDSRAMNNLGVLLEDREPAEARRWYERAALTGHLEPMKNLGRLLEERAPATASRWFERAAAAGDTEAMHYLPILLQRGSVVEPRRWLERATEAANAGDVNAMNTVAIANSLSDRGEAIRWFESAAQAGSAYAMSSLGWLLRDSQPDAARRWYELAAETGDLRAMNRFGELLQEQNAPAARRWFERAANGGNTEAMTTLGWLIRESEPGEARRWLERAARERNYDAMNNLAVLIQAEDPDEARRWYELAASVGHLYAAKNLAYLLVDSDPNRARGLLKRAADGGHRDAAQALELLDTRAG